MEKANRKKRHKFFKRLNLIAGIILLIVAIIEIVEEYGQIGTEIHHGLAIFAFAHVTSIIVEILDGTEKITEAL